MHYGTLPTDYRAGRSELDANHSSSGQDLTRRRFLGLAPLTIAFVAGAGLGVAGLSVMGSGASVDAASEPAERGSEAWAVQMVDAPAAELIAAAGELERVRMRSGNDPILETVFVRLLEVALVEPNASADEAGAIAIRCLYRLGVDQQVEIRSDRILDHEARPRMKAEFARLRGR